METFFSICVLCVAIIASIFFGVIGFVVIFGLGVFFQVRDRMKKKRERDRLELLHAIYALQKEKNV